MKNSILDSFNSGSKKYDKFSKVQVLSGKEIFRLIKENILFLKIHQKLNPKILELGCGTCELTKKVLEHLPFQKIELVDISTEMIKISKQKIKKKNVDFIVTDFDIYEKFNEFDLIYSNMAIHWSDNIEKLINKILIKMKTGSIFIFSYPNNLSFKNLKKLYSQNRKMNYMNDLPEKFLTHISFNKKKFDIDITFKNFIRKYKDPIFFLNELKHIGANAKKQNRKSDIFFLRKFKNMNININFNVSFFAIKKLI